MIEDLSASEGAKDARFDVCVIGAGAAGISLATALAERGVDVCLVEAGGREIEPELQEQFFAGESSNEPVAVSEGRYRVFGGATRHWTGRCATLDPIDFEHRSWVANSGWPFSRAELNPYYLRAQRVCGFELPWRTDAMVTAGTKVRAMKLDRESLAVFVWRYAPLQAGRCQDWSRRYGPVLRTSRNIHTLLNASLTDIERDGSGDGVKAIIVRSLSGASRRIEADHFVLACGAIENTRLLLNIADRHDGFGNIRDQVGRYFQQHPRTATATFAPSKDRRDDLQDLFNIIATPRGTRHEFGFSLPPEMQRSQGLLNCSAILRYEAAPGATWEHSKYIVREFLERRASLRRTLAGLKFDWSVALNILRRLVGRHALLAGAKVKLIVDLEQVPDPESRIMLSDQTDAFGLRKVRIDWRISDLERRTAIVLTNTVGQELEKLGLGRMTPTAGLEETGGLTAEHMLESYHHLGSTRMSADPAAGVVDADCRVHGVRNLYVAGGSVVPTGGHANPTFTIVAIALRLADHLAWVHHQKRGNKKGRSPAAIAA